MTDALDLIAMAETTLRERVAPGGPEARYHALLAANALATAHRELTHPPRDAAGSDAADGNAAGGSAAGGSTAEGPAQAVADVAAIRAGRHDDDVTLHARLLAAAARRAWIADPTSTGEPE